MRASAALSGVDVEAFLRDEMRGDNLSGVTAAIKESRLELLREHRAEEIAAAWAVRNRYELTIDREQNHWGFASQVKPHIEWWPLSGRVKVHQRKGRKHAKVNIHHLIAFMDRVVALPAQDVFRAAQSRRRDRKPRKNGGRS